MTILYAMLILHIITGLIGVMSAFSMLIGFLRRVPKIGALKGWSLVSAISFILSWISGAYYYVLYYGGNVKPIILKSAYPWAHQIVMEAKEHVFLFIPLVSIVVSIGIFLAGEDILNDKPIKKSLAWLTAFVFILGVVISLAGVGISGAVRG
ncbi:MAG: hypothetical protein A2648_01330 [Candidatus Lloydbacteria bacterium RIFCSPHIGHO2_01_FULL_41_20]|uniref:DUF2269 domain-containing protein n=1 Tax=Candidatus Lloydbacteria bacterium RIFCSPHIGHO2_01_FULL_41_20 TaxID=1798657 RepID=A0A1G2CS54_9BACT|nr:MAG: hypothetical protein A2648_01330 [Candidatus Lloydbacteria bacterium RIFCSPHIGHO2_01_FULL_41_20]